MSLVALARGDVAALAPDIGNAIWSVDKDLPIDRVDTMDDWIALTDAERQFTLILFEAFGIAALALAAVGIRRVLSGSVTERTRETGIRLALGAPSQYPFAHHTSRKETHCHRCRHRTRRSFAREPGHCFTALWRLPRF